MGRLVFRGVTFTFGGARSIFDDVTFQLDRGVIGVAGENGAGKTTLLRLAAGELAPDRGAVRVEPAGALVVSCPQTVEALGDDVRAMAAAEDGEAMALRDRLGLDPASLDRWSTLSPGERRRWQLGAALHREPDVLLADEPTNHLDREARARVTAALRSFRGLALVVSHDRAFLDGVTRGTLRVHNGRVDVYTLPYSQARAAWEQEARARDDERQARKAEHAAALRKLAEARDLRASADANRSSKRRMKDKNDHDARGMGAKVVASWAEGRFGRLGGSCRAAASRCRACRAPRESAPETRIRHILSDTGLAADRGACAGGGAGVSSRARRKHPMPDTLEDREVDLLKRHLGAIVTLESLTVPLYLTAVYSFTETALAYTEQGAAPLYDMQQKLLSVAVQEMYHLQLASNLCNAFQVTPQIPRLRLVRGEDIVIPHIHDDGKPIVVRLGNVPSVLAALLEIEEPVPRPYPDPNEAVVYPSIAALYHATLRLLGRYMEAYRTTATALDPHFVPNNKQIAFATFASTYRFNAISSRPLVAAVASAITDQGEGHVVAAQIGGPFRSSDEDDVLPEFRPRPGTRFAAYGKEAHYTRFREVERDLAARDWASAIGGPVFYEDTGEPSADLPPWAASEEDLEGAMSTLWSCLTDVLQEGTATGHLPAYSKDPSKPSFGDVMLSFKYVLPQRWQQGRAPSFVYRPGVTADEVQKAMDIVDPLCLFHWDARTQAIRQARHFNACQGLNSCKGLGWGGIATEPGNGACATVELHTCGGNNACRFHGGCGFLVSQSGEACAGMPAGDLLPPTEQWVPGANSCRALGGCQTPISTRQVFSRAAGPTIDSATGPDWDAEAKSALKSLRGHGVWERARQIFAWRMRLSHLPEPLSGKVEHMNYDGTARRAAIAPTSR